MLVYKQILTSRIVILLNGQPFLLDFCMCTHSTIKALLDQNCNEELIPQAYPSAYWSVQVQYVDCFLKWSCSLLYMHAFAKEWKHAPKKKFLCCKKKNKYNCCYILAWELFWTCGTSVLSLVWVLYSASNIWLLFWQMEAFKCLVQC